MAFLATIANGQEQLADWFGQQSSNAFDDFFGSYSSAAGDVDLDGTPDIIVTAPKEDPIGIWVEVGSAYVFSGATHSLIRVHHGSNNLGLFGTSPMGGTDFDGDGTADYVIGARQGTSGSGYEGGAYAYSGVDGHLLYSVFGDHDGSQFGSKVTVLGDLDGDQVDDLGVAAPQFGFPAIGYPNWVGRVHVFSGASGASITTFTGTIQWERMGTICRLDDLTGDGVAEFGIGSWAGTTTGHGRFDVIDGALLTVLYSLQGESPGDFFSYSAVGLGDLNRDGTDDFLVAAPLYSVSAGGEGRAYIYSGASANVLFQFDGTFQNQHLGEVISPRGDVDLNGDGYSDLLFGSPVASSKRLGGTVDAYSGRTGKLLYQFRGSFNPSSSDLGSSVCGVGDLNADGIDDIVIGAPNNTANFTGGHAYAFAGNDLFLQASFPDYSAGDTIRLDLRGGEPHSLALIALVDVSGSPLFVPIVVGALNVHGNLRITDTVPSGLTGLEFSFMGYAVKAGGKGLADSSVETVKFK